MNSQLPSEELGAKKDVASLSRETPKGRAISCDWTAENKTFEQTILTVKVENKQVLNKPRLPQKESLHIKTELNNLLSYTGNHRRLDSLDSTEASSNHRNAKNIKFSLSKASFRNAFPSKQHQALRSGEISTKNNSSVMNSPTDINSLPVIQMKSDHHLLNHSLIRVAPSCQRLIECSRFFHKK